MLTTLSAANKAEDGVHPVMTTLLLKLLPFGGTIYDYLGLILDLFGVVVNTLFLYHGDEEGFSMSKQFVLEAVMLAIYGELMNPSQPVEYLIPASTIRELDEFLHSPEPFMLDPDEEKHVRSMISEMIQFFRDPFTSKKMEKSLIAPWSTVTFPTQENVSLTVVKAEDNELWGELFDPIETELLLASMRYKAPLLTDQEEWQDRILEYLLPVQFYDIDDFEFAVEQGISLEDVNKL